MTKQQIIEEVKIQLRKAGFNKGHVNMKKEFNSIDIFVDSNRVGFFSGNAVYIIKDQYKGGCDAINTKTNEIETFLEIA